METRTESAVVATLDGVLGSPFFKEVLSKVTAGNIDTVRNELIAEVPENDRVIGELTDTERTLFVAMLVMKNEVDDLEKDIPDPARMLGDLLSGRSDLSSEGIEQVTEKMKQVKALIKKRAFIKILFWEMLEERFPEQLSAEGIRGLQVSGNFKVTTINEGEGEPCPNCGGYHR